jgi:hypothetical protein
VKWGKKTQHELTNSMRMQNLMMNTPTHPHLKRGHKRRRRDGRLVQRIFGRFGDLRRAREEYIPRWGFRWACGERRVDEMGVARMRFELEVLPERQTEFLLFLLLLESGLVNVTIDIFVFLL